MRKTYAESPSRRANQKAANKRWREKNREAQRLYMREYQRIRRANRKKITTIIERLEQRYINQRAKDWGIESDRAKARILTYRITKAIKNLEYEY